QGIVRDVTEREQLERQLQHAQKMEALGTLAGGVAHEFNNILMTFRGYIQILQMRAGLDPEVGRALEKMNQSTRRAGALTQKMLTFSRMEAGEKVPVQVNQVIKDMESLLRQTFPPGIRINMDLAQDLPVVLANPNQIEQVLVNLALNARDAMEDHGNLSLTTRLATLNQEFCLAHPWAKPGPYVRVQVADDGPGIPPKVLERIFEPFFTTKEPGRGTGLGLSVAYSLIKNHGGGILAVNRPQGGGAFRIFLPVSEGVSLDSSRNFSRETTPKGSGQRLLVVDDEEAVRDICRQALETFGYQVTLASDGVQGVETFRQAQEKDEPFDLVLMDLAMPKMDGRAAGKAIWEMDPQARIIITTGHGGDRYQVADLYPQAQGVLQKPFDLSSLLKEVNRILTA
ncbi:MAG: response regulator, partial [Pseudomonadota bacterium]